MQELFGVINTGTFILGVLIIIITPGPNSLYVLGTGVRYGRQAGFLALAGVFTGDAVLMFMASAGVAAAVTAYPASYTVIRYAGAAYLTLIGATVLYREYKGAHPRPPEGKAAQSRIYAMSFLVSMSNPNTIIFYVAFFVQFVDPDFAYKPLSFLALATMVQMVSISYLTFLIFTGHAVARFFTGRPGFTKICRCLLGLLFLTFGCRLAFLSLE